MQVPYIKLIRRQLVDIELRKKEVSIKGIRDYDIHYSNLKLYIIK